jgi:hypothetical protein
VERDVEGKPLVFPRKEPREEREVGGAAYREKFRYPLNRAEH